MLYINKTTTKKEFLDILTKEAARTGILEIFVTELPSFLNTAVAFTVFTYQISNYPREIVWISDSLSIVQFLEQCGSKVQLGHSHSSSVNNGNFLTSESDNFQNTLSTTHVFDQTSIVQNKNTDTEINQTQTVQQILNDTTIPEPINSALNVTTTNDYNLPLFSNRSIGKNIQHLNVQTILENEKYQPSSLLDSVTDSRKLNNPEANTNNENTDTTNSNTDSQLTDLQNLDVWLKRIESTKSALDDIRNRNTLTVSNANLNLESNNFEYLTDTDVKAKTKNPSKLSMIILSSAVFSLMVVSFLITFPTKAYTIALQQTSIEDGDSLSLNRSDFEKKTISMRTQSSTPASGQKEVSTERSIGKISLINNASNEVDLNNGLFRLLKDDREYQAIFNPTLPKSFSIPARNASNGNNLSFNIQASETGDNYNLDENTKMDIVNLLGQKVCSNCYAITTTPIKNSVISGNKSVSEADKSLLQNNVEAIFAQTRNDEIKKIDSENVLTNQNWFKNLNSNYIFNKNIGETTDSVSLNASVDTDIYFLSKSKIFNDLKSKNQEIDQIIDFDIVDNSGNLNDQDTINLKIFFRYTKQSSCYADNKDRIKQTLTQKSFDYAKVDIQKTCPEIRTVEKKDMGVNMPGIPYKVDIIVKNT